MNLDGGKKKYPGRFQGHISFSIPEHFRKLFAAFNKIIYLNKDDPEFRRYCENQEGFSVESKISDSQKGLRSMYIRWLISEEVMEKNSLLIEDGKRNNKTESEQKD